MAVQTQTGKGAGKVKGEEKTEPLSSSMSTKNKTVTVFGTALLVTPLVLFTPGFPTISKSPNLGLHVFLQYSESRHPSLAQQNQNHV